METNITSNDRSYLCVMLYQFVPDFQTQKHQQQSILALINHIADVPPVFCTF